MRFFKEPYISLETLTNKPKKKQTKRGSVKLTKYNNVNVLSFDLVTKSGLNLPLRPHILNLNTRLKTINHMVELTLSLTQSY